MLGASFFDGKRMSSQPKGYCWAFQHLTGKPVHGYIISAIRSKEIPQYVLNGKTFGKGDKAKTPEQWWNESLQREKFILKETDLAEWEVNTITLIEELLWHYRRGYMPMRIGNEHACVNYGKCAYYDVCSLHPEDRLRLLSSGQYTTNEWSPLKK